MKKTCILLNASAGSASRIERELRRAAEGPACELCATESPQDSVRAARRAIEEGVERLVVAGGDGSIGEVVQGIAPDFDAVELGIVPAGTANDLSRCLDLPCDDLAAKVRVALEAPTRPMDVVRFRGSRDRYWVNAVSAGFGGDVGVRVRPVDKQRFGSLAYWIVAASMLGEIGTYDVRLTIDGETEHHRIHGLGLANGRFVGGGFPIAPDAMIDDGEMDVAIVPATSGLDAFALGLDMMFGRHAESDHVLFRRGRTITLESEPDLRLSIDGEPTQALSATHEVLPRVLRVATGPHPVALGSAPRAGEERGQASRRPPPRGEARR